MKKGADEGGGGGGGRLHSWLPEERVAAASLHKAIRGPYSPQMTGDAFLMMTAR